MAETSGLNPETVVVIGGSTGSIDVLLQLLPALPNPLPYALIVVVHRKNTSDSALANLLSMKATTPVQEVEGKDVLTTGTIYLAPADYHLLLEKDGTFTLDYSEKVQYSRPSIDVTFESVADVYGAGTIGILLSGANADGTAGLQAVRQAGGTTLVQHPDTAQVDYMPRQAMQHVQIDHVLTVPEMTDYLNRLARS